MIFITHEVPPTNPGDAEAYGGGGFPRRGASSRFGNPPLEEEKAAPDRSGAGLFENGWGMRALMIFSF